jgi:hypothetical protein
MRGRWKLLGLAGAAGVAATGAVVARNRRPESELEPDELRDRLRARLEKVEAGEEDAEAVTDRAQSVFDIPAIPRGTPKPEK